MRRKFLDAKYFMILPSIGLILLVTIFPFIFTINLSAYSLYGTYDPIPEKFVGLSNYMSSLTDPKLYESIEVTITYTAAATLLEFVIGLGLAILMNRPLRFKRILIPLYIVPMAIAPAIYGTFWTILLNLEFGVVPYYFRSLLGIDIRPLNMANALWTLVFIDTLQWTPFVFLILYAALQSLPAEPFESAIVDGASRFQIFRHITLPLLSPAMGIAILFRSIGAYKAFDTIMVLTGGGPGLSTTSISYYVYRIFFLGFDVGKGCALTLIIGMALFYIFIGIRSLYRRILTWGK